MCSWAKIHTGCDVKIQPDLEKPRDQWSAHPMIDIIYKDIKDWQGMNKRQDPITKSMIIWLINSTKGKNLHCFTYIIIDFLIIGIQTGWRGVEWAQPKCQIKNGFYEFDKSSSKFVN